MKQFAVKLLSATVFKEKNIAFFRCSSHLTSWNAKLCRSLKHSDKCMPQTCMSLWKWITSYLTANPEIIIKIRPMCFFLMTSNSVKSLHETSNNILASLLLFAGQWFLYKLGKTKFKTYLFLNTCLTFII